ncbi:899_t:CDS:2 [Funneliformis mosseae]|uniref:899_t:CDS:1 n=1 Tax=Funneliformis mosseae TaxID=27381 RepID=A0A9N8ZSC1_FUNMO|nr:899_t:CDS:2 [Funneliformis mosseae]
MVSLKLFSFVALIAYFVSSAESAPICTISLDDLKEPLDTYIVVLQTPSDSNEAANVVKSHFEILEGCAGKSITNIFGLSVLDGLTLDNLRNNPKNILNFSVKGLSVYTGKFTDSFVKNHLSKLPEILSIRKDIKYQLNDAIFKDNLDRVDERKFPLDGLYQSPDGKCQGANVYVLDTGINTGHTDFEGRAKFAAAVCTGCQEVDDNGHGTMVAGIVGGKQFGVAKLVNLFAVKVLNAQGSGFLSELMMGINFVVNEHENSQNKKTIINMSLGFGQRVEEADRAVKNAHDRGIIVVVAAGNENQDTCNVSPAAADGAIAVGATELSNDKKADFSNFGKCTDIFAPGRDIESALFLSPVGSQTASGTSFSAPHVAGAVACIIANEDLNPEAAAKKLYKLSTKNTVEGISSDTPNQIFIC